ncbi:MAG: GNAT family N-acetyltransferase [Pseudomonadota bacterium]
MVQSEVRVLTASDQERLQAFLEQDLDRGLILYSNITRAGLSDGGRTFEGTYAAYLVAGEIVAVAGHFWNGMLLVQGDKKLPELTSLCLSETRRPMTGVLGPRPNVESLSRLFADQGFRLRQSMPQELMVLDMEALATPQALTRPDVICRRPRSSEIDLLSNWRVDQERETLDRADDPKLRRNSRTRIERSHGEKSLWVLEQNGRIVANCEIVARAGDRVQIGNVRTPPAYRNQGFARAVIAGALGQLRNLGIKRAILFVHDPAAKRAYQALGFSKVGDFALEFWERCDELVA